MIERLDNNRSNEIVTDYQQATSHFPWKVRSSDH